MLNPTKLPSGMASTSEALHGLFAVEVVPSGASPAVCRLKDFQLPDSIPHVFDPLKDPMIRHQALLVDYTLLQPPVY